jgi:hypothetical protein
MGFDTEVPKNTVTFFLTLIESGHKLLGVYIFELWQGTVVS